MRSSLLDIHKAAVEGGLTAAGLFHREVDLRPGPAQDQYDVDAGLGAELIEQTGYEGRHFPFAC